MTQQLVNDDPLRQIQKDNEMNGAPLRVWSIAGDGYTELNGVGVGLTLWEG
jgi:hypothetical protein